MTYSRTHVLFLIRFIAQSAERRNLTYFIPCHGGVHCITLSLPGAQSDRNGSNESSLSRTAVVAGHFFWNIWL